MNLKVKTHKIIYGADTSIFIFKASRMESIEAKEAVTPDKAMPNASPSKSSTSPPPK